MKILYITRTFYPEGSGGEISAKYIVEGISKYATPVVCCLSENISEEVIETQGNITIYKFPWKKLSFSKKLSNLEYVYYQLYKACKKVIEKENPDAIHFLNTGSIFPLIHFFKRFPRFATCNGPWFCTFGGYHDGKSCYKCSWKEKIKLSFKRWKLFAIPFLLYSEYSMLLLRQGLKQCKRVFPVSEATKTMLLANGIKENKIEIINNPILENKKVKTTLKNKLGLKEERVILYTGRLSDDKGIQHVIKSLKSINQNVVFLIIGKGRYQEQLEKLTRELGLNKKVRFIGFVSPEKVEEYYSITDVFVLAGQVYDTFPRAVLEASSYGIPCIVSNIGGAKEIIEHGKSGIVLENVDEIEISKAISRLLSNKEEYRRYSKNATKRTREKFNLETIGEKLFNEYKKVL